MAKTPPKPPDSVDINISYTDYSSQARADAGKTVWTKLTEGGIGANTLWVTPHGLIRDAKGQFISSSEGANRLGMSNEAFASHVSAMRGTSAYVSSGSGASVLTARQAFYAAEAIKEQLANKNKVLSDGINPLAGASQVPVNPSTAPGVTNVFPSDAKPVNNKKNKITFGKVTNLGNEDVRLADVFNGVKLLNPVSVSQGKATSIVSPDAAGAIARGLVGMSPPPTLKGSSVGGLIGRGLTSLGNIKSPMGDENSSYTYNGVPHRYQGNSLWVELKGDKINSSQNGTFTFTSAAQRLDERFLRSEDVSRRSIIGRSMGQVFNKNDQLLVNAVAELHSNSARNSLAKINSSGPAYYLTTPQNMADIVSASGATSGSAIRKRSPGYRDPLGHMSIGKDISDSGPSGWMSTISSAMRRFWSKPEEGSTADILGKVTKRLSKGSSSGKAVAEGSPEAILSSLLHGAPGKGSKGGLAGNVLEQFRHAAIWQAYQPLLAAPALYAYAATSPHVSKMAATLQGLGANQTEMGAAMGLGFSSNPADPFRHAQQSISTSKWIMSAFDMSPTVEGQLESYKIGKYLPILSNNLEFPEEKTIRLLSRGVRALPDKGVDRTTQAMKFGSGLMAAGNITDITGEQLLQNFAQGASAFDTMFAGSKSSAAEALAFMVPLVQAGVPNVGRGALHYVKYNDINKMAQTQVFLEMANESLANGGDLNNIMPYKQFKKKLEGKKADPAIAHRVWEEQKRISSANTAESRAYYMARYGRGIGWSMENAVEIPMLDAVFMRMALAEAGLESPDRIGDTKKTRREILRRYHEGSLQTDYDNARPPDSSGTYASQAARKFEGFAQKSTFLKNLTKGMASWATVAELEAGVREVVDNKRYTPDQKALMLDKYKQDFTEAFDKGMIKMPKGYSYSSPEAIFADMLAFKKNYTYRDALFGDPNRPSPGNATYSKQGAAYLQELGLGPSFTSNISPDELGGRKYETGYFRDWMRDRDIKRNNYDKLFPGAEKFKDPLELFKGTINEDGYMRVTIDPKQFDRMIEANPGWAPTSSTYSSPDGPREYVLKRKITKHAPESPTAPPHNGINPATNQRYVWGTQSSLGASYATELD